MNLWRRTWTGTKAIRELHRGVLAITLFIFPQSSLQAALRAGIVSDFGVCFWIDGGYDACCRHLQRGVFLF